MNHRASQMHAYTEPTQTTIEIPVALRTMDQALFILHLCYFQDQSQIACTAPTLLNRVAPAYVMVLHPVSTEYPLLF